MKTHSHWFEVSSRTTGMLAFMLQRISGIGLVAYLFLHLALLNQLRRGPLAWDNFMQIMRSPWVLFWDAILLFGISIHGLNGLRLTLIGFGRLLRWQGFLFWTSMGLAVALTLAGIAALK
jgi:succinate dehydrogenase / fumarate reductase cytochrome b subunit